VLPIEVAKLLKGGVRISFDRMPPPLLSRPRSYPLRQAEERDGVRAVVKEYLEVGAIVKIPVELPVFMSPIFGRQKADNKKWRLITDLTILNRSVHCPTMKMEHIGVAAKLVEKGDYFCKIDVKHAYFHLGLVPSHCKFMAFVWEGQRYMFKTICFGLNIAPRLWTKTFKIPIRLTRKWGIRSIFYIDDLLIFGRTPQEALLNAVTVARLLMWLGYRLEWKKCDFQPRQAVEFLGFTVDSVRMEVRCGEKKMEHAQNSAREMLRAQVTTARKLGQLAGIYCALRPGLAPAYLYTRAINADKTQAVRQGGWEQTLTLSREASDELRWWVEKAHLCNGNSMLGKAPDWVMTSDASGYAWGATLTPRHALPADLGVRRAVQRMACTRETRGAWDSTETG